MIRLILIIPILTSCQQDLNTSELSGDSCGILRLFKTSLDRRKGHQKQYKSQFYSAAKKASAMIKQGSSFKDIDSYLAAEREKIKMALDQIDTEAHLFGKSRIGETRLPDGRKSDSAVTVTSLANQKYPGIFYRVALLMKHEPKFFKISKISNRQHEKVEFITKVQNPLNKKETIELTGFMFWTNNPGPKVALLHPLNNKLSDFIPILDHLYQKARHPRQKHQALKNIGLFHWWYSNIMPYFRGSSSIAKMHVTSLLRHHKIDLPTERLHNFRQIHGLDIDEWALTLGDPEIFAKLYEKALMSDQKLADEIIAVPEIKNFYSWWFSD